MDDVTVLVGMLDAMDVQLTTIAYRKLKSMAKAKMEMQIRQPHLITMLDKILVKLLAKQL